jgi:hypothetical protein
MHPTSRSPEALLVRELVPALQGNPAAAAACLRLEASLTGKASFNMATAMCFLACAGNLPTNPFCTRNFACDG